ncbi:MAG: hypothetical protein ACRD10_05710, partial [Terriglobia bacterium]
VQRHQSNASYQQTPGPAMYPCAGAEAMTAFARLIAHAGAVGGLGDSVARSSFIQWIARSGLPGYTAMREA